MATLIIVKWLCYQGFACNLLWKSWSFLPPLIRLGFFTATVSMLLFPYIFVGTEQETWLGGISITMYQVLFMIFTSPCTVVLCLRTDACHRPWPLWEHGSAGTKGQLEELAIYLLHSYLSPFAYSHFCLWCYGHTPVTSSALPWRFWSLCSARYSCGPHVSHKACQCGLLRVSVAEKDC